MTREVEIGPFRFRFDEDARETTIVLRGDEHGSGRPRGWYIGSVAMNEEAWEAFVAEAFRATLQIDAPDATSPDAGPIDLPVARALRDAGVKVSVTLTGPDDVEGAVTLHLPMRATFAAELLQYLGQRGFQFAGEEAA